MVNIRNIRYTLVRSGFDTKSLILCKGGEWLRASGQLDWQEGNNVDICTGAIVDICRGAIVRPAILHTRDPLYPGQIVDYLVYTAAVYCIIVHFKQLCNTLCIQIHNVFVQCTMYYVS